MTLEQLLTRFAQVTEIQQSSTYLQKGPTGLHWKGLVGSAIPFYLSGLQAHTKHPILLLAESKEKAAYWQNDFEALLGSDRCWLFPASYRRPYEVEDTDNANVLLRAEVLDKLKKNEQQAIIVTYAEALAEKLVTRKELDAHTLQMAVGDLLSLDFVNETLF